MNFTNGCGINTVILKKDNEYYYTRDKCKLLTCPRCSVVILESLKMSINYYVGSYNMNKFLTLTTGGSDISSLQNIFKKMIQGLKKLNKDYYIDDSISRSGYSVDKAESSYICFINKIIDYELSCFYLFDYEGLEFKNYNNIGIKLTNMIISGEFLPYLISLKIPKKKRDLYIERSLRYRKPFNSFSGVEKYEFFHLYKEVYFDLIDYGDDDVSRRREELSLKVLNNVESTLSYLWVLEYQENDNPHYHILLNYYVPYYFLHLYSTKTSNISKCIDLTSGLDSDMESSSNITNYITKYITKDIIEYRDIEYSMGRSVNIIGSSHDLSLSLSYPKVNSTSSYELVKTIYGGVAPSSFGLIGSDYYDFERGLKSTTILKKNIYIQAVHDAFNEYKKDVAQYGKENKFNENFKIDYYEYKKTKHKKFLDFKSHYSNGLILEEMEKRKNVEVPVIRLKESASFEGIDPQQKRFIESLSGGNNIIMLNGSAGTGKTTTISYALDLLDFEGLSVEFVAPTGKASSVISSIAKVEGKTIHRMADAVFNNLADFNYGENNLLDVDVVFVDEVSMVDTFTFGSFLNCFKSSTRFVLIGDSKQLSSINSLSVIDIIEYLSGYYENIEIVTLLNNYRSEDNINKIATDLISGDLSSLPIYEYDISQIVKDLEEGYQALTNTRQLSHVINKSVTSEKSDIVISGYYYNIGDSIMVCRNNKSSNIFNGDLAVLDSFDSEYIYIKSLKDDSIIKYSKLEAYNSLRPCGSITIHKSQGSEYDDVVIVLDNYSKLLTNNILYTAITRARHNVKIYLKDGVDVDDFKKSYKDLGDSFDFIDVNKYYNIKPQHMGFTLVSDM